MGQWEEQLDKLKQLIEIMKEHNLVEVRIKQGEDEISAKKGQTEGGQAQIGVIPVIGAGIPALASGTPTSQAQQITEQEKVIEIKSPLVGTIYAQPSPDSEPFVELGSRVEPQTVVCIIEAMKVMNEIKAEVSGRIVDVVAINGEAVEYGQVLFKVKQD
jgi:acetyl-CoA carboxylase biotin carboxyl carrier protein